MCMPRNIWHQTEIAPTPTITLNKTALHQILVPGKNTGLPNSSNPDLKDSHLQGQVNERETIFITDSRSGQKYVKDRVIVRFKTQNNAVSSISQEKIRMAHAKMGAKVEKEFITGGVAGLQLVKLPNGTDVQSAIQEYESNPDVLYAEPDYRISIIPDQTGSIINDVNFAYILSIPNDPYFADNQWSFNNTGQTGGTPGADIDAPGAWNISIGSNNVIVAVIDTGVLYTHSDLSANIWNNTDEIPDDGIDNDHNGYTDDIRGWNFINNTSDPIDDNQHGTHVSGTIGAVGNNAIGVAGVNWHVQIMPLKAFDETGSGGTFDAIKAIDYANANGASVISNSWGGGSYSQSLEDAINASSAVVVCAAGNSESNNDGNPMYPASYSSPHIIAVAATDNNDNLVTLPEYGWGTNYGATSVDLAAPGTNIWSTYLDGNYISMSGTSMATPHVSGVAALVKSVNQSLTAVQIKNIILSTVDVKSSLSGKVASGGRLNAYKAVEATPPAPPVADFIGTPRSGTAPIAVVFSDFSANLPTTWNWTFGDGSTVNATVRNPIHTYLSGGNFTVSLNVTNSEGFNSTTKVWYINLTNSTTKIGIFRNGFWYLDRNGNGAWDAGTDNASTFGTIGWTSVIGDWNGDGKTEIGIYKDGIWYLDRNGNGAWDAGTDKAYTFGGPGWTSIVGDWNATGKSYIGVTDGQQWYLDRNGNGAWDAGTDKAYTFGGPGWTSVVGDWNATGKSYIGVTDGQQWYLDWNGNGAWDAGTDKAYTFGGPGWTSVIGDWNGDGKTEIGIYKDGIWYLDRNGNGAWDAGTDKAYTFGGPGWTSVIGDWNGDGKTEIGIYKDGIWYLDWNGNGAWDAGTDTVYNFGTIGWTSVVGKWS